MISSIYPQDKNLLGFLNNYYDLSYQLGIDSDEKLFTGSIRQLEDTASEPLVHFLYLLLNNLCQLLVRPTVNTESGKKQFFVCLFILSLCFSLAEVPRAAFSSLAHTINRVHELKLAKDKHDCDIILAQYIQYVFTTPLAPTNTSAFDPNIRRTQSISEDDGMRRSSSMRQGSRHVIIQGTRRICTHVCLFVYQFVYLFGCIFVYMCSLNLSVHPTSFFLFIQLVINLFIYLATPRDAEHGSDSTDGAASAPVIKKLFYEELVYSWITAHPATRSVVYSNAWFFFEVLVRYLLYFTQDSPPFLPFLSFSPTLPSSDQVYGSKLTNGQ